MRADLVSKGKSLTGSSDLTLFAKLKPGLVPALEALSYKTRTQRLLKLLQGGRVSLHEYAINRPLSDAVERVARIHSFRVAVVEPEDTVMLAVTFDGTWESYIRVLWQKVGSLLDIIFCNTEDYVLSTEGFEAWCVWVRRVQVETAFYFNTHGLTVDDVHWLRGAEAIQRSASCPHQAALDTVRHRTATAEQIAYQSGQTTTLPALDNVRQGLQSLALLFRMTDVYLPGTPDGEVLLRAARDLLMEFRPLVEDPDLTPEFLFQIRQRFQRQLDWLFGTPYGGRAPKAVDRPLPGAPKHCVPDRPADVQGGMLNGHAQATHGCLVLLAFDDAAVGARLLARVLPRLATEATHAAEPQGHGPFFHIAFSFEGLRRLGTHEGLLALLPNEFREGMPARASMLGDFRVNHPRRWRLPRRNWRFDRSGLHDEGPPIDLSAVHAVLTVRCHVAGGESRPLETMPQPLHDAVMKIVLDDARHPLPGVQVLSVQEMHRNQGADGVQREHFGFADGKSQPVFPPGDAPTHAEQVYDNRVHLGELLLGYDTEADFAPVASTPEDVERLALLHNGSFMVVRKLRQDVAKWNGLVAAAATLTQLPDETLRAKMMGRWSDGSSLVDHPDQPGGVPKDETDNDFDFHDDADGSRCPVHSHVRRTNPRLGQLGIGEFKGRRRARIVRRGMSYGPAFAAAPADERGMVFIAFNASIAEQFETVQRWVSGGNSSGGFSGHADPFMGVPEPGQTRVFRFEHSHGDAAPDGTAQRGPRSVKVDLDTSPEPFGEPEPVVRLEWGAYLFCPSVAALTRLQRTAAATANAPVAQRAPLWSAADGKRRIAALLALEAEQGTAAAIAAWKAALEDAQATEQLAGASLWAAVRQHHAGVLRTPYGVLVASHQRVMDVLGDDSRFSVSGYHRRMVGSNFDIYLGLDRHPLGAASRYEALSGPINAAIGQLGEAAPFELARRLTLGVLQKFVDGEIGLAQKVGAGRWELNIDVKEVVDRVLSGLCQRWLGVAHKLEWQDPAHQEELLDGSWRWNWAPPQAPLCPVHFTPPSRYFFQPHPGDEVREWGERCAGALTDAMTRLVRRHRSAGTLPMDGAEPPRPAPLAKVVFESLAHENDATVGRSLAGVMMGFLPTLDGSFRLVMNEWLRLGTFWQHRAAWAADGRADTLVKAEALLDGAMRESMQFRPTPELIWRTAAREHDRIGDVDVVAGDTVVLALVSASQQRLAAGSDDVYAIFGGMRRAGGPTHACPGYDAAMAVMLGMLAGWVGSPHHLRASPAPLAFTLEGETPR